MVLSVRGIPLSEFAGELQGASLVDVLIGLEENQH